MRRISWLVILLVGTSAVHATTLGIQTPLVAIQSPVLAERVSEILSDAIELGRIRLSDYADVHTDARPGNTEVTIQIIVTESEGGPLVTMLLSSLDGTTGTWNYASGFSAATGRELSEGLIYLYRLYAGKSVTLQNPPQLVGVFRAQALGQAIPGASQAIPRSISIDADGNLVFGLSTRVVRTDPLFRVHGVLGGRLLEQNRVFASTAHTTPTGEIIALSSAGDAAWRIAHSEAEPVRINLPASQLIPTAVATDGTLVGFSTASQTMIRVAPDGTTGTGGFRAHSLGYPYILAAGPGSTIYTWDVFENRVVVWDTNGLRLGGTIPLRPYEEAGQVRSIVPYPDGSIALITSERIEKYDRDGTPVWELDASDVPGLESLYYIAGAAFDSNTGSLYLLSGTSSMVVHQLLDAEYLRAQNRSPDPMLENFMELYANVGDRFQNVAELEALASAYREMEAWEYSYDYWTRIQDLEPGNPIAREGLRETEFHFLMAETQAAIQLALETLDTLGPANARPQYEAALRLLERLRALTPDNTSVQLWQEQLQSRYESRHQPVQIAAFEAEEIFPSLFSRYQERPVGTIELRNPNSLPVTDLVVSMNLQDFMSSPWISRSVSSIEAGGSVIIPFHLPVNAEILKLPTRLTGAPVVVTTEYEIDSERRDTSSIRQVVVHPNTAITWDDTGKLASFVTPTDELVEVFSSRFQRVSEPGRSWQLSDSLLRAIRVTDALGTYGVEYIEDPDLGISKILGDPTVVDRVLYPRNTLRYRRGDCDDTTALLASLLESISVSTAIMTSPGHVFLGFDTGEPEQNLWLFETEQTTGFVHAGSVWLPIETTILQQGFQAAWTEGSRLLRRHSDGSPARVTESGGTEVEFLPISNQWETYPQLPLEPASFEIYPPSDEQASGLHQASLSFLRETLYENNLASLERSLETERGRARLRALNQIGILHARFEQFSEAEIAFSRGIDEDPEFGASYINLANLSISRGEPEQALHWLDQGDSKRRPGIISTLLRAQAEYLIGNWAAAVDYMALVEQEAPELALRYPHLLERDAKTRASYQGAGIRLPWSLDPEESFQ